MILGDPEQKGYWIGMDISYLLCTGCCNADEIVNAGSDGGNGAQSLIPNRRSGSKLSHPALSAPVLKRIVSRIVSREMLAIHLASTAEERLYAGVMNVLIKIGQNTRPSSAKRNYVDCSAL